MPHFLLISTTTFQAHYTPKTDIRLRLPGEAYSLMARSTRLVAISFHYQHRKSSLLLYTRVLQISLDLLYLLTYWSNWKVCQHGYYLACQQGKVHLHVRTSVAATMLQSYTWHSLKALYSKSCGFAVLSVRKPSFWWRHQWVLVHPPHLLLEL